MLVTVLQQVWPFLKPQQPSIDSLDYCARGQRSCPGREWAERSGEQSFRSPNDSRSIRRHWFASQQVNPLQATKDDSDRKPQPEYRKREDRHPGQYVV